jgi:hypothetical protein
MAKSIGHLILFGIKGWIAIFGITDVTFGVVFDQ